MQGFLLEVLINTANLVFVVSYLVTDILWLRTLSVIGGALSLTHTLLQPEFHFSWIAWGVVYNVINVAQIVLLVLARRPVRLDDDEQRLWSGTFRILTPRDFKRLLSVGAWRSAPAGERLVEQGVALDRMLVLTGGTVTIHVDGSEVARLGQGRFVGEMSFLGGGITSAAVDAIEPTRYVAWPRDALEGFLRKNPDVRSSLQLLLGKDLVAKLARPHSA